MSPSQQKQQARESDAQRLQIRGLSDTRDEVPSLRNESLKNMKRAWERHPHNYHQEYSVRAAEEKHWRFLFTMGY